MACDVCAWDPSLTEAETIDAAIERPLERLIPSWYFNTRDQLRQASRRGCSPCDIALQVGSQFANGDWQCSGQRNWWDHDTRKGQDEAFTLSLIDGDGRWRALEIHAANGMFVLAEEGQCAKTN